MNDDSSPDRSPGPDRLWTDPREEEEHQPWLAPRVLPPTEELPLGDERGARPAEPPPRRTWPLVLLGALAAAMLVGAGMLGAILLRGDEPAQPAALPVSPGAAPADSRSKAVRSIYASVSPSVVRVRVRDGSASASGTGFLIDGDGTIVTNAHVVGGADQAQVRLDDNAGGIDAQVLGTDESSDLAVLRIDAGKTGGVRPLTLADSDDVQVGDLAVAIGYPLGLDRTATEGIVSGLGRAIKAPNGFQIDKVIQTDAPINPGNSGGPLLDAVGRVIGVNSQIATTSASGGSVGIGFAVPSNTVREVVPRLQRGGTIRRAYLGVETLGSTVGTGALVTSVIPAGPAQAAGLQPGDVISGVAGEPIQAPEDVSDAIQSRDPGEEVEVEVLRAGATRMLRVTLGTRPENTP
jgi:putative serine protease PepD